MKSETSKLEFGKQQHIRKFANTLDLLVGHEDKHLFRKVDKEIIEQTIQKFPIVDDDGNSFSIFSSVQKFQKFAPGVYLMFKLLKHLILMFCAIGVLSIIQMLILLKSPFYTGYDSIVRINMLRLTIASLQLQDYDIYIVLDICIVLLSCGFLIWWNENLRKFGNKCNQTNQLPSYLTVQLNYVDPDFTEESLKEYLMNTEGITPQEIYTGRNYGKFLKHYKNLTETAIDLRVSLLLYLNQEQEIKRKSAHVIIKKFLILKNQYFSIKSDKFNERKYKPKQVFIVLKNYSERSRLLKSPHNRINIFSSKKVDDDGEIQFSFKPCQVEPEAINWQNIGISFMNYAIRALIVFLVLCAVTFLGIVIIFMLEILQTASIGDAYHYHQENLPNFAVTQSSASSKEDQCVKWSTNEPCHSVANYAKLAFLIMLTPLTIFVCKKVIMALLSHFVHFRKYSSQVSKIKSQTITLTIFYFIVIGALHLFLYLKADMAGTQTMSLYQFLHPFIIKMFNLTNYKPASIHLYSDYSLDWYKEATFFIVIICSTSFNISNGFKFLVNFFSYLLQKKKARKQATMYGVKKALHGVDLHMDHVYASMIVINYFSYLYGCPIPVTACFALINLIFLFYTTKWSFIKYGRNPLRMGHSINRTVTNLLFIGVIIRCIMAPIFLCAQGIGRNNSHYKYNIDHPEQKSYGSVNLTIEERYQKLGPYYLTIASLLTIYFLFRKVVKNYVISKIKQKWLKKQLQSDVGSQMQHFGLYPSYSMHNNHEYGPILRNIYLLNRIQARRITCPLPETFKDIEKASDNCLSSSKIFDDIQNINREYLDKQKHKKMHEEVEKISRVLELSSLQIRSMPSERATNDRLQLDSQLVDAVKQNEQVED